MGSGSIWFLLLSGDMSAKGGWNVARDRANINTDIWNDDDFRALSAPAQLLYMQLLTSKSLSYSGVADWRPNRIAVLSAGRKRAEVESAAEELQHGLYIVVDEDTEEVLVRSFLRWDGLLQKPNVSKAMVTAWNKTYSMTLKGVVVHELKRLHEAHPDWRGFTVGMVQELLRKGSVNPSELVSVGDAPLLTTNYLLPTTDNSLPAPAVRVVDSDFERAWIHWPKKTERKKSFEQFKVKAKTRGLEELIADVIRFGKSYANTTEKRFVPSLDVWLRNERWTDEAPTASTEVINAQWDAAMGEVKPDPCAGGHKRAVDGSCVRCLTRKDQE